VALPFRLRVLLLLSRLFEGRPFSQRTISDVRRSLDRFRPRRIGHPVSVGAVRDILIPRLGGSIGARFYTPTGSGPHPLLMFFHGGGWIWGDLDLSDHNCRTLCRNAGCAVLSVDYRLAPENKFPAAVDDCLASRVGSLLVGPTSAVVGVIIGSSSLDGTTHTITQSRGRMFWLWWTTLSGSYVGSDGGLGRRVYAHRIHPKEAAMFTWTSRVISALLVASTLSAAPAMDTPALRFFSSRDACSVRVQINSLDGQTLFDSDWKEGNLFDFLPEMVLLDGKYRATITSRNIDGEETLSQSTFSVRDGRMRIDPPVNEEPKITTLTHDGTNGAVITTAGDLSFRFGDFLKHSDVERIRLTSEGLIVQGVILATEGIRFADDTMLTSGREPRQSQRIAAPPWPALPLAKPPRKPASFSPAYQFVTGDTGVTIGVTNPDYKLDVSGPINTATRYDISGTHFVHNSGGALGLNAFVGINAGNLTMTGSFNTGLGAGTLPGNSSGADSVAVGYTALYSNTDASDNTAVGYEALKTNQHGSRNTAVGSEAMLNFEGSVTASNNTAMGYSALAGGIGASGINNTAVGANSMYGSNLGTSNVVQAGSGNTAVGMDALGSLTTGIGNVAAGYGALQTCTSGNYNIAIGYWSGKNVGGGENNIYIGNVGVSGENNTIRIADNTYQRVFIDKIRGVTTGSATAVPVVIDSDGQLGTVNSSRSVKFDIADMADRTDGLMHLRPVTFRYLAHGDEAPLQYGLIAEEVAEVYPDIVARDEEGQANAILYQFLAPMLLNEVQLQRKTIGTLHEELMLLKQQVAALERRVQ